MSCHSRPRRISSGAVVRQKGQCCQRVIPYVVRDAMSPDCIRPSAAFPAKIFRAVPNLSSKLQSAPDFYAGKFQDFRKFVADAFAGNGGRAQAFRFRADGVPRSRLQSRNRSGTRTEWREASAAGRRKNVTRGSSGVRTMPACKSCRARPVKSRMAPLCRFSRRVLIVKSRRKTSSRKVPCRTSGLRESTA